MRLAVAAFAALLSTAAHAQVTPIGPFVGQYQEDWEAGYVPGFPLCQTFDTIGQICSSAFHVTGSWGFNCQINPQSGSRLAGSAGDTAIATFAAARARAAGAGNVMEV